MKEINIIIFILLLIVIIYSFNTDFKIAINTNYNKYSSILENKIFNLHNNLLNKNPLLNDTYDKNLKDDLKLKSYNQNTNIVLIITLFTGILFFFIHFYDKKSVNVFSITIYIILVIITFYIVKSN